MELNGRHACPSLSGKSKNLSYRPLHFKLCLKLTYFSPRRVSSPAGCSHQPCWAIFGARIWQEAGLNNERSIRQGEGYALELCASYEVVGIAGMRITSGLGTVMWRAMANGEAVGRDEGVEKDDRSLSYLR